MDDDSQQLKQQAQWLQQPNKLRQCRSFCSDINLASKLSLFTAVKARYRNHNRHHNAFSKLTTCNCQSTNMIVLINHDCQDNGINITYYAVWHHD